MKPNAKPNKYVVFASQLCDLIADKHKHILIRLLKTKAKENYLLLITDNDYLLHLQQSGLFTAIQTIVDHYASRLQEKIIWQLEELNPSTVMPEPLLEE